MASVVSCSKMLSLLVNRKNINMLTNVFVEKPYRPLEVDEMRIRYKFDRLIYINTLYYAILVETTCACITVTSLFTMFRKGNLTYRAWLPYDYNSSTIVFCLTYAHQLISLTAGSLVNVACDSLICGLLVHICCQIEILECRLSKISDNHDALRDCVRHHDSILQYALELNYKFRMTIAMQFIVSTLVVCSNLYQMTKSTSLNASYLPLLLYMSCMLTQIFIYCWYGNEVKLKSTQLLNNIFAMDWVTMNRNVKESLLIIMNRAVVPIEFTSAYVLSMNLDSFVGILKTSYSVYNILKQVLEFTLKILTIVGCWPPNSWTSLCKRTVYNAYTAFVILLLFTFMLSQLMDVILNVDNTDDFTDTFYIMLAIFISCCKMVGLLINRKNIGLLTNILTEKPFIPLEADEIEIRHKFDRTIQTNTLWYTILVDSTCGCVILTSLFTDFQKGNLTYREWTPYNYTSEVVFCVIYARQLISSTFGAMVNVACDSLICGLLLHVCCQLEILECRLKKSSFGQDNLRDCVRQHDCIFKFALMVNEKFKIIIAIQFIVSTLVVCSNLYQLARITLNAQCFPLVLYTCSMLTQILIYCWYGNEVKLKSVQLAPHIFEIGWLTMKPSRKQNLLIIMNRSLVPIEFSSAYILTMNLESFVSLLKTSYSAYNILQQMQTT
ncbi:PREDICTED: odorant receptor 94a-like [Wasmannia auropunctata]|uniref:odorant receptor 94a-like n=1 Tax=Wasmannia auropunctata TaxID=64793 RepID=UPI0005EDDE97|nr:PREDICTED: odorant receptor 94a-like [Wasmannia auropunctata]